MSYRKERGRRRGHVAQANSDTIEDGWAVYQNDADTGDQDELVAVVDTEVLADVLIAGLTGVRVGIVVSGGVVQDVLTTSRFVDVTVADHDNLDEGDTLSFDDYPVGVVDADRFEAELTKDVEDDRVEPKGDGPFTFEVTLAGFKGDGTVEDDRLVKRVAAPSRYALNQFLRERGIEPQGVKVINIIDPASGPEDGIDVWLDGAGFVVWGYLGHTKPT